MQLRAAVSIQSNGINGVMNIGEEVQTVFYTTLQAALFGLGCVSLDVGAAPPPQIWSSGPRAK